MLPVSGEYRAIVLSPKTKSAAPLTARPSLSFTCTLNPTQAVVDQSIST